MGSFMARTAPPPAAKTTETSPASLLDDATMHLRLILVVTALLGILVERLHTSVDGKLLKPAKNLFFLAGVLALSAVGTIGAYSAGCARLPESRLLLFAQLLGFAAAALLLATGLRCFSPMDCVVEGLLDGGDAAGADATQRFAAERAAMPIGGAAPFAFGALRLRASADAAAAAVAPAVRPELPALRFLFIRWRSERYYYTVPRLLRNLLIAFIPTCLPYDRPDIQIVILSLLIAIALVHQIVPQLRLQRRAVRRVAQLVGRAVHLEVEERVLRVGGGLGDDVIRIRCQVDGADARLIRVALDLPHVLGERRARARHPRRLVGVARIAATHVQPQHRRLTGESDAQSRRHQRIAERGGEARGGRQREREQLGCPVEPAAVAQRLRDGLRAARIV